MNKNTNTLKKKLIYLEKSKFLAGISQILDRVRANATHFLVVAVVVFFSTGERLEDLSKWFGFDECHYYNLETGKRNWWNVFEEKRKCMPGEVTFVRWTDSYNYNYRDDIKHIPNRVLQVVGSNGSTREWREATLGAPGKWDSQHGSMWISVAGAENVPLYQIISPEEVGRLQKESAEAEDQDPSKFHQGGRIGMVLRRPIPAIDRCNITVHEQFIVNDNISDVYLAILEAWIEYPRDADANGSDDHKNSIYIRWINAKCGEDIGANYRTGGYFSKVADDKIDLVLRD